MTRRSPGHGWRWGRFVVDASSQRDYSVVQGVHLLIASIMLLGYLLVDVTYAYLDPRIRYQSVVCLSARGVIVREGSLMYAQHPQQTQDVRRRELLKAGLLAGVTLSAWPLTHPAALWGAAAAPPKRRRGARRCPRDTAINLEIPCGPASKL